MLRDCAMRYAGVVWRHQNERSEGMIGLIVFVAPAREHACAYVLQMDSFARRACIRMMLRVAHQSHMYNYMCSMVS